MSSNLGHLAFEAFCKVYPKTLRYWDDLHEEERDAWNAAGIAVAQDVYRAIKAAEPCPDTIPQSRPPYERMW